LAKAVTIPEELLRGLALELSRVGEVLATIEELPGGEGLRRIRGAGEEYRKGGYIAVESSREAEKLLK
jgi:hypothetical protein